MTNRLIKYRNMAILDFFPDFESGATSESGGLCSCSNLNSTLSYIREKATTVGPIASDDIKLIQCQHTISDYQYKHHIAKNAIGTLRFTNSASSKIAFTSLFMTTNMYLLAFYSMVMRA